MSTSEFSAASATPVSVSTVNATLFAGADGVHGRAVYVPSGLTLYLRFGANASTTTYTNQIVGPAFFALPAPVYSGQVDAVASGTGTVLATQW